MCGAAFVGFRTQPSGTSTRRGVRCPKRRAGSQATWTSRVCSSLRPYAFITSRRVTSFVVITRSAREMVRRMIGQSRVWNPTGNDSGTYFWITSWTISPSGRAGQTTAGKRSTSANHAAASADDGENGTLTASPSCVSTRIVSRSTATPSSTPVTCCSTGTASVSVSRRRRWLTAARALTSVRAASHTPPWYARGRNSSTRGGPVGARRELAPAAGPAAAIASRSSSSEGR